MLTEDRLRELLRDPGWSLPAWPDAQARVRKAARRQRMALARLGSAVTAIITMAAVVPVLLLNRSPGNNFTAAAASGPAGGPFVLPAVGMAGFSASAYPAAVPARVMTSWLRLCPSAAGLQAPGRNAAVASLTVLHAWAQPVSMAQSYRTGMSFAIASEQQAFSNDLLLSDRAFWPRLASGGGITEVIRAAQARVLYSGPLRSYPAVKSPLDLASVVAAGCGSQVLRDTWVIISGHPASPMRAAEAFFLKRSGRVLLYNATSRVT